MQDRLSEIRERVNNVSGEEWIFDKVLFNPKETEIQSAIVEQIQGHDKYRITVQAFGKKATMADADFIANAPADIRFLLDALEQSRVMEQGLRDALNKLICAIDDQFGIIVGNEVVYIPEFDLEIDPKLEPWDSVFDAKVKAEEALSQEVNHGD